MHDQFEYSVVVHGPLAQSGQSGCLAAYPRMNQLLLQPSRSIVHLTSDTESILVFCVTRVTLCIPLSRDTCILQYLILGDNQV